MAIHNLSNNKSKEEKESKWKWYKKKEDNSKKKQYNIGEKYLIIKMEWSSKYNTNTCVHIINV